MSDPRREERIRRAQEEAVEVFKAIQPLDLEPAAEWLEQNRPSWDAIAMLAMWLTPGVVAKSVRRAGARHAATAERRSSLRAKLRRANVWSFADARKLSEFGDYTKRQITVAISRNKAARKSP